MIYIYDIQHDIYIHTHTYTWSVFIGLINWKGLHLSPIWAVQLLSQNVKVYFRLIVFHFAWFISWQLYWIIGLRISFTSSFFFVSSQRRLSKKFVDWEGLKKLGLGELLFCLESIFVGGGGGSVPHYMPCLR